MQAGSSHNPRETQASITTAYTTLSPNSRELEDGEVINITELTLKSMGYHRMLKVSWSPTMYHLAWLVMRNPCSNN
jgi:hypothetical protein